MATLVAVPSAHAEPVIGSFTARGSINQVATFGHAPGTEVRLRSSTGDVVATGAADPQGAFLFKDVPTGSGYVVAAADGTQSEPLTVTDPDDHPDPSFYESPPDLPLEPVEADDNRFYGYLPTRDGTTLSMQVGFPMGDFGPGPWPVIVNYTGYSPSNPLSGLQPETLPFRLMGYVVVGVNIRGSGCSGGAFDFFEAPQWTDGYDIIETVANQSWSNGDVGMFGISYGGYSQLYVGATQPPHLRAMAALSPYDDTYRGILYPGGIINDGFASEWANERFEATRPFGQGWTRDRVFRRGDAECWRNQILRLQNRDIPTSIRPGRFDEPEFWYLNTRHFVPKIKAPTYLVSQFQDEQVGGHAASLIPLFPPDTEVQATFTNGTHVEPMGPTEVVRAMAFIDFYVGKRVPVVPGTLVGGLPFGLAGTFGVTPADLPLPENPWAGITDYDAALRWFEASPPIRIRWENGGVAGKEGLPFETATSQFPTWPIPSVEAEAHYLQPDGLLGPTPPSIASTVARSRSTYRYDPSTKAEKTSFADDREDMWKPHPDVAWLPLPEGDALSYLTEPFTTTAAYAGTGSVDLWLRSNAADTDLEVSLTEVRPDGSEVYIQSGWLRASHRALDPELSTELRPYSTHQEGDAQPLPRDTFEPMRIEIFPFAHVVRPGSRLRLNIEAPSGNQPFWSFKALDPAPVDGSATVSNEIGHATNLPSRVMLPRLPDHQVPAVPATAPSCDVEGVTTQSHSLRNQPCRSYVAPRIPTGVTAARVGDGDLAVAWSAPPGPDVPTGHQVTALATGQVVDVPAGVTTATFVRPTPGVRHEFVVRARYGDVLGPPSDASPIVKTRPAGAAGTSSPS